LGVADFYSRYLVKNLGDVGRSPEENVLGKKAYQQDVVFLWGMMLFPRALTLVKRS